ncbi:hypothetical protein [Streptomyces sp. NBC_00280]|uniref:hypothetical protein n=1 Tax=Streptomyces sp. NBC_00280 TaxID=2975699 RepID=UPI0032472D31
MTPDPGQMGLGIGEGQDGTPLRWGRRDGASRIVDELIYPHPVSGPPAGLGDDTWRTHSISGNALRVRALGSVDGSR